MSPIKIVIIGILLYIGYLLIRGSSGKKKKKNNSSSINGPAGVSDVLVEDPVCKKLVPKQQAVTTEFQDKTIYFCSEECCNTFVSEKGAQK
jgi:YHS domain-containing protein